MRTAPLALLLCLTAHASAAHAQRAPAPVLTAPDADTKIADGAQRAELRWRPAGDATVYEVQFLTEGASAPFLKFFVSGLDARLRDAESDVVAAQVVVHPARRILWRVRGFTDSAPGLWSGTRSVTMGAALPPGPHAAEQGGGGGDVQGAPFGTLEASIQQVKANVSLALSIASENVRRHPEGVTQAKAIGERAAGILNSIAHVREGNQSIDPLLNDSRRLITEARQLDPEYQQRAIEGPRP